MNKYDILMAIKEIQCRYSLPAFEKNFTDKDYACKQYEKLVIHLANQQEQKDKEKARLNNVINELEKFFKYEFDNEVRPLNDRKISVWAICLDKLKELKEGDKDE